VRLFLARDPLPHRLAGGAIDRQHLELMHTALGQRAPRFVLGRSGDAGGDRGQQVDPIAPDHRRRRPATRDLDLPLDVLRLAPLDGRLGGLRDTGHGRPAPLRPVALIGGGRMKHQSRQPEQDGEQDEAQSHGRNTAMA